ncbi:MAG: hypothetical protein R6U78_07320 [Bacteroidales bacterium]
MAVNRKHKKIDSLHDISLAKERCRYEILLQEQALSEASRHLRTSFRTTFRNSMIQLGQVVATTAIRQIIQSRMKKK